MQFHGKKHNFIYLIYRAFLAGLFFNKHGVLNNCVLSSILPKLIIMVSRNHVVLPIFSQKNKHVATTIRIMRVITQSCKNTHNQYGKLNKKVTLKLVGNSKYV